MVAPDVATARGSDAEKARPVTAANRIGAKRSMWLVGRVAAVEVTRRNDALRDQSTANCECVCVSAEVWLICEVTGSIALRS